MDHVWPCSKHREFFQEFYWDFTSSVIKSGSRDALKKSQSLKGFYFMSWKRKHLLKPL